MGAYKDGQRDDLVSYLRRENLSSDDPDVGREAEVEEDEVEYEDEQRKPTDHLGIAGTFSEKISRYHKEASGHSCLADQHHQPARNVFGEENNEDNSDKGDCGDNDRTERRRCRSSGKSEELDAEEDKW